MHNKATPKEEIMPTIVTAYYKLDLSKSQKSYKSKRTVQTYLDYFRFYARVPNTFIIYTNADIAESIMAIRAEYGLESKTFVIQKDLESFDKNALDSMREVFANHDQSSRRFDPHHPPHTSPEYNYLMYCKSFFVLDSLTNPLTKNHISAQILWLDFGYNFAGAMFGRADEFDFALIPQKPLQDCKMNLFCLGADDLNTLPHILIYGTNTFLTGGLLYGSHNAWHTFNVRLKEALHAFLSFQIMDDDQKLFTWCVRKYPNEFAIHYIDDWFNALFYFIPDSKRPHLTTKKPSILATNLFASKEEILQSIAPPSPRKKRFLSRMLKKCKTRLLRQKKE